MFTYNMFSMLADLSESCEDAKCEENNETCIELSNEEVKVAHCVPESESNSNLVLQHHLFILLLLSLLFWQDLREMTVDHKVLDLHQLKLQQVSMIKKGHDSEMV